MSCVFSNYAFQIVAPSERSHTPTHFLVGLFLGSIFMGTYFFFGIS